MNKVLYIILISFFSLSIVSCSSSDDAATTTSDNTTTTTDDTTSDNTTTSEGVSCAATIKVPTITGCNGVDLTAASSIDTQSSGIISTLNGFGSSAVLRIEDEQYIDLKDEGCLQLGKDGGDFALSMWLKASGPSTDQTEGSGSQIIGTKSQYDMQKPGWLLHTEFNVTKELQDAGINNGRDGRLILKVLSSPADGDWTKTVMSEPFPADTWTHVVLNYRNNANSGDVPVQKCSNDTCGSEFSIYVNLIGPTSRSPGHGTQAAIDNIYFSTEDGGKGRLRIGDEGWGEIRPFEITDFKSYSSLLTESERKALFLSNSAAAGFSLAPVVSAIDKIGKHIAGEVTLSSSEVKAEVLGFVQNSMLIDTDEDLLNKSLDLVDAYENGGGGPLFLNDNTTVNGWPVIDRIGTEGDGKEIHRGMFSIQQSILDEVYNTWTVGSCS